MICAFHFSSPWRLPTTRWLQRSTHRPSQPQRKDIWSQASPWISLRSSRQRLHHSSLVLWWSYRLLNWHQISSSWAHLLSHCSGPRYPVVTKIMKGNCWGSNKQYMLNELTLIRFLVSLLAGTSLSDFLSEVRVSPLVGLYRAKCHKLVTLPLLLALLTLLYDTRLVNEPIANCQLGGSTCQLTLFARYKNIFHHINSGTTQYWWVNSWD